jgi:hypothetical protein
MARSLLVLFALCSPCLAYADIALTALYGVLSPMDNSSQAHMRELLVKKTFDGDLAIDANIFSTQSDATNQITNRYELGLTAGYELDPSIRLVIRPAIGEKVKIGVTQFGYYSVEPGITYKLPDTQWKVGFALRERDSFDGANHDRTDTLRYSLTWLASKEDVFVLGYDVATGYGASTALFGVYTHIFH